MRVWLFTDTDGVSALTIDEEGANLPEDLGPWVNVAQPANVTQMAVTERPVSPRPSGNFENSIREPVMGTWVGRDAHDGPGPPG